MTDLQNRKIHLEQVRAEVQRIDYVCRTSLVAMAEALNALDQQMEDIDFLLATRESDT